MKQIIEYDVLLENSNFVPWFLMNNFPEGLNDSKECTLSELIQEECILDKEWVDKLTGYYEGVFDENDGYVDNPNAVVIKLSNGDEFCIEFHPGDTIYYVNDSQIGCTGPSYMIRKISLKQFIEYTSNMTDCIKIFLLPMIKIIYEEKDDLEKAVKAVLSAVNLQGYNIEDLSVCILENSLE